MTVTPRPGAGVAGRGNLSGVITDESGQPIIGAMIQVSGPTLQGFQGAATDTNGRYILILPPGKDYQVKVEAPGYNSVVRKGITIQIGTTITLPFTLSQGSTVVTVTAAAPIIDVKKTEVAANISDKSISTLPLGRNSDSVAFLAPGIVESGVEGGVEGGILGGVVAGAENSYTVNGVDVQEPKVTIVVRHDFRATAFWQADVLTNKEGVAIVKVPFPESLTAWRATARAATVAGAFGISEASVRTRQDLTVRLQSPRFFVVGDRAIVSALIQNEGDREVSVVPAIRVEGLRLLDKVQGNLVIPAKGSARADWTVVAETPGSALLQVEARGKIAADAMEKRIPVLPHGIEAVAFATGRAERGDVILKINLPKERAPGATALEIQISPGPAVAALDALPYLIGYPYGCTEQTMSRFLPTVIAAKTLKEQGLTSEVLAQRLFGQKPFDSQGGMPPGKGNMKKLNDMADKGLARLYTFHHADGGWGWWERDASDPFMTAYVLGGLCIARDAGVKIPDEVLQSSLNWLLRRLATEGDDNLSAWMLYAAASCHTQLGKKEVPGAVSAALERLSGRATKLEPYALSLFALSARSLGKEEWARAAAKDLSRRVQEDGSGLAHWGQNGSWWHWYLGPTETTAFALRALIAIDPRNPLAGRAVDWLMAQRQCPHWSNTRDTAMAVLALNDYLLLTRERMASGALEIEVNGREASRVEISEDAPFLAPSRFPVEAKLLRDGVNEIRVVRHGGVGTLYASAFASFYSLEEPAKELSAGLVVRREYVALTRRPTLLKGDLIERHSLPGGSEVTSGDRVECTLTLTANEDSEYVLVEDARPAGFETVQLLSGSMIQAKNDSGQTIEVYQELRDTKAVFFLKSLPKGTWEMVYELRAEGPGTYHATPAAAQAMYAPHLRGNGAEVRIIVREKAP